MIDGKPLTVFINPDSPDEPQTYANDRPFLNWLEAQIRRVDERGNPILLSLMQTIPALAGPLRSDLETNVCRYEVSYCGCGHKVFSNIMLFFYVMPILLSDLIPPNFSSNDAQQAFLVRIEDARSGITGPRDVADHRLILGWDARRKLSG
jgi:hypothetical protein